jgi:broad specificity phosphatase PhoE
MKVVPILTRAASTLRLLGGGTGGSSVVVIDNSDVSSAAVVAPNLIDVLPPLDRETCVRRIFLLRHGETDWNARGLAQGGGFDIELNESGRRQARLLARAFCGLGIDVVASSHLQRAQQTAHILHDRLERADGMMIPRAALAEFGEMRFGDLEGTALRGPEATEESRRKYATYSARMRNCKDFCLPGGGESTGQVVARGTVGLQRLYEEFPEAETFAIVAHGRFNKILLSSLLYGDPTRYVEVHQGNTCINVIDQRKDGSYALVLLNSMDHVTKEGKRQ